MPQLAVVLLLALLGSVQAACPHLDASLKRWSSVATWPGGQIPQQGSEVNITTGVLLDVVTPDLTSVTILPGGRLVFDPSKPRIKLTTRWVLVDGEMWIGAEGCPFTGRAEVELYGKRDEDGGTVGGQKTVAVNRGLLEVHGEHKLSWTQLVGTLPKTSGFNDIKLTMTADVTSWKAGDRIVISSTDYDMFQAEEFTLKACGDCTANQVKIEGPVFFEHWGEVTDGVDMRAHVGVLNRNVKFYGRMENACYGQNLCNFFNFDTFGGHIKILRPFRNAHIENAELTRMGQQPILGTYPVHFHMCHDVDNRPSPPYVRNNAIHRTFSRCVTVHGTHGVTVENNMAYNHLGHCYFLEDGGEKRNVLRGNLGMNTKRARLIPTDRTDPTTFWITNPNNTLEGNVAAGSEAHGFWYVFPHEPLALSQGLGFMQPGENMRTPIGPFRNNVAHSNWFMGMFFEGVLKPDGTVSLPEWDYIARQNPLDPNSPEVVVDFHNFLGYKNRISFWSKIHASRAFNFVTAESLEGTVFDNIEPGTDVYNGLYVGETANKGKPRGWITLRDGRRVFWHRSVRGTRQNRFLPIIGSVFYGNQRLHNCTFRHFKSNALRPSGAIGFRRKNDDYMVPTNEVDGLTFEFVDPSGGNRVFDANTEDNVYGFKDLDGNYHQLIRDVDGSLTTYAGSSVVKSLPVHANARCTNVPNWHLSICPVRFTKMRVEPLGPLPKTFITRDDIPGSPHGVQGTRQISYALNPEQSYILHFRGAVPRDIRIAMDGVEQGVTQRVGVCVGPMVDIEVINDNWSPIGSLAALDAATSGHKYFHDRAAGIVFVKFINPSPRLATTTTVCPGTGPNGDGECPYIDIWTATASTLGDCRSTAYPKYITQPLTSAGGLSRPTFT